MICSYSRTNFSRISLYRVPGGLLRPRLEPLEQQPLPLRGLPRRHWCQGDNCPLEETEPPNRGERAGSGQRRTRPPAWLQGSMVPAQSGVVPSGAVLRPPKSGGLAPWPLAPGSCGPPSAVLPCGKSRAREVQRRTLVGAHMPLEEAERVSWLARWKAKRQSRLSFLLFPAHTYLLCFAACLDFSQAGRFSTG